MRLNYLKCSMPNCYNTVGQHSSALNKNKQVCATHRGNRKNEVDDWKLRSGCSNKDSHYGFPCVSTYILDPCQIDINHIDGNNDNRDPSNIECLCAMCHRLVTIRNEHHIQTKASRRPVFDESLNKIFTGLFEVN